MDDTLVGSFTIADIATNAAFGGDATGFRLDPDGSRIELPDLTLAQIDLQTFDPATLEQSAIILLGLAESSGNGRGAAVELGPLTGVQSAAELFDNLEVRLSLPGVQFSCALFGPIVGTLIPPTIEPRSSRFVRLLHPRAGGAPIGGDTWLIGFHGQAVGPYGTSSSGRHVVFDLPPTPTPTPQPTPTVGPTGASTPTPFGLGNRSVGEIIALSDLALNGGTTPPGISFVLLSAALAVVNGNFLGCVLDFRCLREPGSLEGVEPDPVRRPIGGGTRRGLPGRGVLGHGVPR